MPTLQSLVLKIPAKQIDLSHWFFANMTSIPVIPRPYKNGLRGPSFILWTMLPPNSVTGFVQVGVV